MPIQLSSSNIIINDNGLNECGFLINNTENNFAPNTAIGDLIIDCDTGKRIHFKTGSSIIPAALTITTSNIGVGTTSPTSNFHIHTSTVQDIRMQLTDSGTGTAITDGLILRKDTAHNGYLWNHEPNSALIFGTNNLERLRIAADGKIGVGTITPTSNFHIHAGTVQDIRMQLTDSGTGTEITDGLILRKDTAHNGYLWNHEPNSALIFGTSNLERLRIADNGNVTIQEALTIARNTSVNSLNIQNFRTIITNTTITSTPIISSTEMPASLYKLMTFTYTTESITGSNQTKYTITVPVDVICEILVVGGGGGGCDAWKHSYGYPGGGGGAGALIHFKNYVLPAGTYNIYVGNGGSGSFGVSGASSYIQSTNHNGIFIRAAGGDGGGSQNRKIGDNGGSGGGAGYRFDGQYGGAVSEFNIPQNIYGNNGAGGYTGQGGGGGGAGSAGRPALYSNGGGGDGKSIDITGTSVLYAGGGGGGGNGPGGSGIGGNGTGTTGLNGTNHTGSGGGGGWDAGGNGGSGIIIIKYKTNENQLYVQGNTFLNGSTYSITDSFHYDTNLAKRLNYKLNDFTTFVGGTSNYNALSKAFEFTRTSGDVGLFQIFQNGNYSAAGSLQAWSDTRIKKEINDIDDENALQMILAIDPKTYKYIDHNRSPERVYGFIAQQIRDVIPEAVKLIDNIIPNIYKNCVCEYNKRVYIELPIDVLGALIRIGDGGLYKIILVENEYIEVDKYMESKDISDGEQFVYGYEVKDFHTINKEYIYTLNVCATQILSRKIDERQIKINDLEIRLARLEALNS